MRVQNLLDSQLFDWWAVEIDANIYVYMAERARSVGCVGATADLMRRELKRRLHAWEFLPNDRPPTAADYAHAREVWRDRRQNEDLN